MKNSAALEDEIVTWLVDLIENDQLSDAIENTDEVHNTAATFLQESVLPTFGIDHLSRRACVHAAETVLDNLVSLEVVSVNKSISLIKDEMLRPDILCFNPKTRVFVIFEVKRDKSTEREAVSELAGYEQELRNVLPLLGQYDILFVAVSTEWNVLLTHAVASLNTWSGKHCLALKVSASTQPFSIACHLPNAWHPRGGVGLPDSAMQTIDVIFDPLDEGDDERIEPARAIPPQTLITATHALARAGDRKGAHGFVMLWQNTGMFGEGKWAWTLCGIDAIALQDWCTSWGFSWRPSALTRHLAQHIAESPRLVPSSTIRIAEEVLPITHSRYNAQFGHACSWREKLSLLQRHAMPTYFEFWGALGDHAREFVGHPCVRGRYVPYIDANEVDWTHPFVALPLLAQIGGQRPFPDGLVRCSDAFMAGVAVGIHENLARRSDASETEGNKVTALLKWCTHDLLILSIEMAEIARTSQEIKDMPPPISEFPEKRLRATRDLASWVTDHLLGKDHPLHQASFQLGREGAIYFSERLHDKERIPYLEAHDERLAALLRDLMNAVCMHAMHNGGGFSQAPKLQQWLELLGAETEDEIRLRTTLAAVPAQELLTAFRESRGKVLDEVIAPVTHLVLPLPAVHVDWHEIRRSIQTLHDGGCLWPAFMVSQSGAFGIGRLADELTTVLPRIVNPQQEVYFLDARASHAIAVKMTWEELQSHIQPVSNKDL